MKMKSRLYFSVLMALVFMISACEETIKLDLKQTAPKVVIEGQVTDQPGYQFVKVTRSASFYSSGNTPRITDATVVVTDDLDQEFAFVHNPRNHADSMGIYIPVVPFVGETGRTYTLSVTVNGTEYRASDTLYPVIPIDKLEYRMDDDERDDPKDEGKFYEVLIFATEPQDETNFYLFKFYRNGELKYYNDTDIYYSDDELLGENIDGVESPVFFGEGDVARVEAYSISRQGYVFYNDLFSLLNNDAGGMFGPIPASPRSNISGDALGFFQVSSMKFAEITIEP
jgi:hypothetical protein